MDLKVICFAGGMLFTYLLFVLEEVYCYCRNRRRDKQSNKENNK